MGPFGTTLIAAVALAASVDVASAAGCQDAAFVDALAASAWVDIDVAPAQGTAGVREALRRAGNEYPSRPVRIRLAPGTYADNLGSEIYAQRLQRSAAAPIWLMATDHRPNATVLMHGINLLGVSYIAIDGVTIGPETVGAWNGQRHAEPLPLMAAAGIHVAGAAVDARRNGASGGAVDYGVYGRYEPSHHILVRRVTVQNLFDPEERDGETSESQSMDGMKFNQVQDLWVLDSRVSQTTRHGIDNVGVHRAAFCRNLVQRTGGGLGLEAKGGSVDVLVEGNTFYRVRRVELGGEDTDATYYFSADGRWDYEALRTVVRNNLIVDAREAALEFSGCLDCSAVGNTIFFSAGYEPPRDGSDVFGGDAIRVHDSRILGADDGAGSDCQYWDAAAQDYVTVDPCWQVGARAPAPVNRTLRSDNLVLANNAFIADKALFGSGGGAVVPCPLNVVGGDARLSMNGNYWWNGGASLPAEGCSTLAEGAASRLPGAGAGAKPVPGGTIDGSSLSTMASSALTALLPGSGSALRSGAVAQAAAAAHDRLGAPRGASVGALAGDNAAADRLFNWAERFHPEITPPAVLSTTLQGYYVRHYPGTQTYVGTAGGHLYVLGPAFGPSVVDLGPLESWLPQALQAGY